MKLLLALLFTALPVSSALACSIFSLSDGQHSYAGNNEDDPLEPGFLAAKLTFSPAGKQQALGNFFFSFDDGYPQGGMNTAGLFYDITAISPRKVVYTEGTPLFPGTDAQNPGQILRELLGNRSTVNEALELLTSYQLPGIEAGQIFLADASGAAAAVGIGSDGRIAVTRKRGKFLLVTNFDVAHHDYPDSGFPEARYELASRMLETDATASAGNALKVLSAIHFEVDPATLYSALYDLKAKVLWLYYFHNYGAPLKIDLDKELRKGARTIPMSSLFPQARFSWDQSLKLKELLHCLSSGKTKEECLRNTAGAGDNN